MAWILVENTVGCRSSRSFRETCYVGRSIPKSERIQTSVQLLVTCTTPIVFLCSRIHQHAFLEPWISALHIVDMGDAAVGKVGANVPRQDLNGPQVAASLNFMERYSEERNKRIRAEGVKQYIDLQNSERFNNFLEDPWVEAGTAINTPVPEDGHTKILIVGAGFGGILFAVRLLNAGFSLDDILIVDPAGGFGGTWYWNRYPGLMCDIESYIYLPLLEEMGYMPKRRYASGVEIRRYLESICAKYELSGRAMFQSSAREMDWDESKKEWIVRITKKPKGGQGSQHTVHADFVLIGSGV